MNILNEKFWVVTKPTMRSVIEDILFKSDWQHIQMQFAGGLTHEQIVGIYTDPAEAILAAQKLMDERNG